MISNSERKLLNKCLSECPVRVGVDRKIFTKEDICSKLNEDSTFNFNSFKRFLTTRSVAYCDRCDERFSAEHKEIYREQRTVYSLNPTAISESVIKTASEAGPLELVDEISAVSGRYKSICRFGEHEIAFEFFSEKEEFLQSDIDPFDMELPVLLRDLEADHHHRHRFNWMELLSERFKNKLSSIIADLRNKTSAVFAEYEEKFISNHRTEIKSSLRDYFNRSGYSVHSEVAKHCPEIEEYGIKAETADYVCVSNNEKILVTHGSVRDGWYMQRFVDGELTSIEDEPIFKHFQEQIDEKIRRYKRITAQLGSAPQFMRGLGGIVAVVTAILAALSTDEINTFVQSLPTLSAYSSEATILLIFSNTVLTGVFLLMLISPYIKEKLFTWKVNSCGTDRSRTNIIRHSKYFLD